MYYMSRWIVLFLCLPGLLLAAVRQVEGVGRAPAERPDARERALTDALRDAVRRGAGIQLASNTEIRHHQLQEDFMYTWCTGYLRDYQVIDSRERAGLLEVTVEAQVADQPLDLDDAQLIKLLVERRRTPRLKIDTEGQLGQLTQQPDMSGVIADLAQHYGFTIIDTQASDEASRLRAERDRLLGDQLGGDGRQFNRNYDFVITCRLRGAYGGRGETHGITTHRYSLGADLVALWPETGETIARVEVPPVDFSSSLANPELGAQDALRRLLQRQRPSPDPQLPAVTYLESLMFGIMTKWTQELDLGTRMRVEFLRIPRDAFSQVIGELPKVQGVNRVWERQYDARLYSIAEVETRLDAGALAMEIQQLLPGWGAERTAGTGLQFRRLSELQNPLPTTPTPPTATPEHEPDATAPASAPTNQAGVQVNIQSGESGAASAQAGGGSTLPGWAWGLIGALAVLGLVIILCILGGGIWLIARRRKS